MLALFMLVQPLQHCGTVTHTETGGLTGIVVDNDFSFDDWLLFLCLMCITV